jgi:hypothetical protein
MFTARYSAFYLKFTMNARASRRNFLAPRGLVKHANVRNV